MSSRIVFDQWQLTLPVIGFVVFCGIFIVVAIRAWRMKRPKIKHLENLPLEDETPRPDRHGHADDQ